MQWEIVIGLETHAQLSTRSKMFSGASTEFGAAPNTQASAVDIALPGVLPVANRGAVERAIRFGLAVNGGLSDNINRRSVFARKNYFYPDLPKGYQISQFEMPIVKGGEIRILTQGGEKPVRLTRAHLEEDAGKSLHEEFRGMSGIDLNRAGTPLLEIVSEPDLRSAEEAVAYAKTLHSLVRWIDICDGNMQEGSFRCDANVSVRRPGGPLGTRCEIKNLNSFRFLERAIEFEAKRQIEILEDGGKIVQETRLYDPDKDETRSMRTKEEAHDYRYFPDPDLLPLEVSEEWVERVRGELPELPQQMATRFVKEYGFAPEHAALITFDRETADDFDEFWKQLKATLGSKTEFDEAAINGANWAMVEFRGMLNARGITKVSESPIEPKQRAVLVARIIDGTISHKIGKEVLEAMWAREGTADEIIERRGLKQISDTGAIEKIVEKVIAANAKQVEAYRAGKEKAFNSLVGQVMKATQGKANPAQVNEILKRKLAC